MEPHSILRRYAPPALLSCQSEPTPVHVIETTGFQGTIYADPSRQLYHALGMDIENIAGTPAGEKKRSYLTTGRFANAMISIWVRYIYQHGNPSD
jgi:hypothetical protein